MHIFQNHTRTHIDIPHIFLEHCKALSGPRRRNPPAFFLVIIGCSHDSSVIPTLLPPPSCCHFTCSAHLAAQQKERGGEQAQKGLHSLPACLPACPPTGWAWQAGRQHHAMCGATFVMMMIRIVAWSCRPMHGLQTGAQAKREKRANRTPLCPPPLLSPPIACINEPKKKYRPVPV